MRLTLSIVAAILFLFTAFTAGRYVQAEAMSSPQEMPKDYAKNDKLQREPGEAHKKMAKRAGKWKVTTTMSPMFGGTKSVGETEIKLVLDGKFALSQGTDEMMGQKMKTLSLLGYDTLAKEYFTVNLNSLYTSAYPMVGKVNKSGVINYRGTMKDAMSPQGRPYRAEEITHSDDKFEVNVFDGTGAKEFKVFTMVYERIK